MLKSFKTIDLGLIDYDEAFLYQEDLVKKRQEGLIEDTVVFCRHPSVVTLGRSSTKEDLQNWKGSVCEVNRGGRATYHGPGQIVVYPIISLKNNDNSNLRSQDVRQYLEALESVIVKSLNSFGLDAKVESGVPLEPGQLNRGIWVSGKKIASLGIAVKKWVTMHGVALNIKEDKDAFTGILACGFNTDTYTSLEEIGVETTYGKCLEVIKESLKADLS
ncbi:MAG: lipoyl(octanoyl) transferase LipB [Bdellovibrionales bacterium]